jgi:hypothetical protein
MRQSPSIAPHSPDDGDVYLVLDDFGGRLGGAWRESPEDRTDRGTVIADLMDGQFNDPVRVVAFNTASGQARDVSAELVELIVWDCASSGFDLPPTLEGFIKRHSSATRAQLSLPLGNSGSHG